MKKGIIYIFFLAVFAVPASGQTLLSLRDAIEMTIARKPSQEVLRLQQRQATLSREEIKALWWPEILFSYNYRYNPVVATTIIPIGQFDLNNPTNALRGIKMGTEWQQNAGLSVTQPVFDLSAILQKRKAGLQERMSNADEKIGRDRLTVETARTYLNICAKEDLASQAVQDTLRTWLAYNEQQIRYDQEKLLLSDLNRAHINHNNSISQLETILTDLFTEKVYLSFLTGLPVDSVLLSVRFDASSELERISGSFLPAFNPDSLPQLRKYRLESQLAVQELKIAKSKSVPVISFDAFLGANQFTQCFSPFERGSWYASSYVGLSLNLPVLYGENLRARNKRLQLDNTIARMQEYEQESLYYHNSLASYHKIQSMEKQIWRLEHNIALEREILSVLDKRLKEYQISAFELNQEEAEYQKQLIELRKKYSELINEYLNYLENAGLLHVLL